MPKTVKWKNRKRPKQTGQPSRSDLNTVHKQINTTRSRTVHGQTKQPEHYTRALTDPSRTTVHGQSVVPSRYRLGHSWSEVHK